MNIRVTRNNLLYVADMGEDSFIIEYGTGRTALEAINDLLFSIQEVATRPAHSPDMAEYVDRVSEWYVEWVAPDLSHTSYN